LLAALFAGASALGAKHKPRTLPSKVKTIRLAKKTKVRPAFQAEAIPANAGEWGRFSREIQEEVGENPASFKYGKSTVRFARGGGFECGVDDIREKTAEAEAAALADCQADGSHSCRIVRTVTARNGSLRCKDFPGGTCPAPGRYGGCKVEALALGEKGPVDVAPDRGPELIGFEN
jgi:hypothetical protein